METVHDNIIELKHISRIFDGFAALSDFNLEVKRGEFVTFLGPSGCGKTTTLRTITGFIEPVSGTVSMQGNDITNVPIEKRNIGMPELLKNVLFCKNPRCITSTEQELPHVFRLTDRNNRVYRCIYCETAAGK